MFLQNALNTEFLNLIIRRNSKYRIPQSLVMAEHFKLPAEVVQPARAFVGLVGLNHVQNAIHRSIWDSFTVSRKQDRLLISFKAFEGNHEYPKANLREPVALSLSFIIVSHVRCVVGWLCGVISFWRIEEELVS